MKEYFKNLQREINVAFESSKQLAHSLLLGNEREIITSRFLQRHMPERVLIENGMIIDQNHTEFHEFNQTNCPQIDLMLINEFNPNLTLYGGTKLIFAESIIAVIEVKSKLTTFLGGENESELRKIIKHCNKVKKYERQIVGMYQGKGGPSKRIPYYVISFESDTNSLDLLNKLKEIKDNQELKDEDVIDTFPDGIFNINEKNSFALLKHIREHEIRPGNNNDNCFASSDYHDGSIMSFIWMTLFQQIEDTRFLKFPYINYAQKIMNIK